MQNTNATNGNGHKVITNAQFDELLALRKRISFAKREAAECLIGGDVKQACYNASLVNQLRLEKAKLEVHFAEVTAEHAGMVHRDMASLFDTPRAVAA